MPAITPLLCALWHTCAPASHFPMPVAWAVRAPFEHVQAAWRVNRFAKEIENKFEPFSNFGCAWVGSGVGGCDLSGTPSSTKSIA